MAETQIAVFELTFVGDAASRIVSLRLLIYCMVCGCIEGSSCYLASWGRQNSWSIGCKGPGWECVAYSLAVKIGFGMCS